MNYKLIDVENKFDERGSLYKIFNQNYDIINDFNIKEVYSVTFDSKNTIRGNHYHKKTRELFYCLSGSIDVELKLFNEINLISMTEQSNKLLYVDLEINHMFKSVSDKASLLAISDVFHHTHNFDTYFL